MTPEPDAAPEPLRDTATVEWRTIDGNRNNPSEGRAAWGRAQTAFRRLTQHRVPFDVAAARPSPRTISNVVCANPHPVPDPYRTSDAVWAWGQFIDHELDLVEDAPEDDVEARAPIWVPDDDPMRDFAKDGQIPFTRSRRTNNELINVHSSFLDASGVYGPSESRAAHLRAYHEGHLQTTPSPHGDLLPHNILHARNAPDDEDPRFFLAGDLRANEHAVLTSLHTVFVREHNRLCDQFRSADPAADDEALYQRARRWIGAISQVITYNEFLPALLGPGTIPSYGGYRHDIEPDVSIEFATVCYRLGHSMLTPRLHLAGLGRLMPLRDGFFDPNLLHLHGIEPFLAGLADRPRMAIDPYIVEDVRTFLFLRGHLRDLAALNIQRGRDHELPDYNTFRSDLDLEPKAAFESISGNPEIRRRLRAAYPDVDSIDPWVGALAEDPEPPSRVGELLTYVISNQFIRARDGDRFWFEDDDFFSPADVTALRGTRLSDVIRRNTSATVPDDMFNIA